MCSELLRAQCLSKTTQIPGIVQFQGILMRKHKHRFHVCNVDQTPIETKKKKKLGFRKPRKHPWSNSGSLGNKKGWWGEICNSKECFGLLHLTSNAQNFSFSIKIYQSVLLHDQQIRWEFPSASSWLIFLGGDSSWCCIWRSKRSFPTWIILWLRDWRLEFPLKCDFCP